MRGRRTFRSVGARVVARAPRNAMDGQCVHSTSTTFSARLGRVIPRTGVLVGAPPCLRACRCRIERRFRDFPRVHLFAEEGHQSLFPHGVVVRGYAHGARAGRRGDARAVGQAVRRGAIEAPTGRSLGFLIWTRRMKPSRARATPSRGVHPAFSGSVTGQIDSRKDQSSDPDFPLGGRPLRRALRSPRAVAQTAARAPRERCRGCSRRSRVPRALSRVALRWRRSSLATSVRSIPRPRVATPTRRAGRSPGLGRRATRRTRSRTRRVSDRAAAPIAGSARPVGTTPTVSIRASARTRPPRARAPLRWAPTTDPIPSCPTSCGAGSIRPARAPHPRTPPPPPPRGHRLVGAARTVSARCTAPGHRRARDLNRRARGTQEHLPPPRAPLRRRPRPRARGRHRRRTSVPPRAIRGRRPHVRGVRTKERRDGATRQRKTPRRAQIPGPPRDPTGPRRAPTTDPRKTRLPRIPDPRSTRTDPNPRTTRQI